METIANLELIIRRRTNRGEKISFTLDDRETGNFHGWNVDPSLPNWRADRERVFVRYGACKAIVDGEWIHITK